MCTLDLLVLVDYRTSSGMAELGEDVALDEGYIAELCLLTTRSLDLMASSVCL
jgi:hypothetical protein